MKLDPIERSSKWNKNVTQQERIQAHKEIFKCHKLGNLGKQSHGEKNAISDGSVCCNVGQITSSLFQPSWITRLRWSQSVTSKYCWGEKTCKGMYKYYHMYISQVMKYLQVELVEGYGVYLSKWQLEEAIDQSNNCPTKLI